MRLAPLALAACLSGCSVAEKYIPVAPPLEPLPSEVESLRVPTADGWVVIVQRYKPAGPRQGLPVLLLHGIGANGRNLDLDADHSLARWLAARGREAFVLNLRGTGYSDRPAPLKGRPYTYNLDTFASQDLPAALAEVRAVTGAAKVDFVGHSMGGLICYVYLARGGSDLNAAVTLGSPARLFWGGKMERGLRLAAPAVDPPAAIPLKLIAEFSVPFYRQINPPIDLLLYNPANVSQTTWEKLMTVGTATISGGVLKQFALWLERDGMVSADGKVEYAPLLAQRRDPAVLVVAGKLDRFATVPAVKAGYDALGGPRQFLVAGEENGFLHDYGHMDYVVGERAPVELWPRLLRFLDEHAPAGRPGPDAI